MLLNVQLSVYIKPALCNTGVTLCTFRESVTRAFEDAAPRPELLQTVTTSSQRRGLTEGAGLGQVHLHLSPHQRQPAPSATSWTRANSLHLTHTH